MRVVHATCRDDFFMKTIKHTNPLAMIPSSQLLEALHERLLTSEQVAVALNLPLHYFNDRRKRAALGIPYYCINRMVRYRIREVHKWQLEHKAKQAAQGQVLGATHVGGRHA
jgi:hypothetical protein